MTDAPTEPPSELDRARSDPTRVESPAITDADQDAAEDRYRGTWTDDSGIVGQECYERWLGDIGAL